MPSLAHTSRVEVLESRIAPASITFIDIDGISVTISSSKGSTADLQQVAILAAEGAGQELHELKLSDLANVFKGANISIVKGALDDNQFVDVGFINALGLDLGKVTVDGDLGRILAGDANSVTPAAKKLTVGSIGVQGLNTQDAGGTLVSKFVGRLGLLTVKGDFKEASLTVLGIDPDPDEGVSTAIDARGDIGDIVIGGNLLGGGDPKSGSIYAKGSIGNITVTGSILGGGGEASASITSERLMGKVKVGGDVAADAVALANLSARIFSSQGMGSVNVGGSLRGGGGVESGNLSTAGGLGNVTILGDIVGGAGLRSGAVGAGGQIGKITIGSATSGGNITGSTGEQSGGILSGGNMKAVKVFGDIVGGAEKFAGSITSDGKIASVFVDGSITGGGGEQSGTIGSSLALGSVNVMGDLVGGGGKNSGNLLSKASIDSVNIEGFVKGGGGEQSGAIGCIKTLGPVSIGKDLQGGSFLNSGVILSGQRIVRVTIEGSIIGSTGDHSGIISSAGDIGSVIVRESLSGGTNLSTGIIQATGKLGSVTIEGDVKGGVGDNSTMITAASIGSVLIEGDVVEGFGFRSGSVIATEGNLGSIVVKGSVDLVENSSNEKANRIQFSAGDTLGTATFGALNGTGGLTAGLITGRNSIGKVTVEDSAKFFQILAGYHPDSGPATSKSKINKVIIGTTGDGNIQGVDIVAGILPGGVAGANGVFFGTPGDSPIRPFSEDALSRISSVVIKGNVISTGGRIDHYGIVAGKIDAVKINGVAVKLTPGLDVIDIQPTTPPVQFTIREVSFSPVKP